jgi:hypothetical protein
VGYQVLTGRVPFEENVREVMAGSCSKADSAFAS